MTNANPDRAFSYLFKVIHVSQTQNKGHIEYINRVELSVGVF